MLSLSSGLESAALCPLAFEAPQGDPRKDCPYFQVPQLQLTREDRGGLGEHDEFASPSGSLGDQE